MSKPYTRKIKIHDANGNLWNISLEITYRNGYPEFTAVGDNGQCQDRIMPKGEHQKKLIDIWNTWHLNGMNAGTEAQEAVLDVWGRKSYEENVAYLKSLGLYETEHDGKPYKYGTDWIHRELPEDFIDTLEVLCDALDAEEDEHHANPVTEAMMDEEFFTDHADRIGITPEKLMAICLHCDIAIDSIGNIEAESSIAFRIEGHDYLVCTDEEANNAHLEYIRGLVDEMGMTAFRGARDPSAEIDEDGDIVVTAGSLTIPASERGCSLSSYDGMEREQKVSGETYYFYRR